MQASRLLVAWLGKSGQVGGDGQSWNAGQLPKRASKNPLIAKVLFGELYLSFAWGCRSDPLRQKKCAVDSLRGNLLGRTHRKDPHRRDPF